ncbi:MAG: AAA family ATPase [Planctomycetes bacterium]|nr:AAA family ATPase [Planctomycetota bacterium]
MSASNMPSNIVSLAFRKVAFAFAGGGRGKGLGQGRGASRNKKSSDDTNRLIDAVLVGGKTAVDALAGKPGIQASLDSMKMRLTTGKREKHEIIEEVNKNADEIIALLNSKGVHIKRLAVDGVPGSGKSTLARALAAKLDFELQTLDYIDLNKPQDFNKEQTIYEHHRLLRTQDVESFDAIIYIDEPVELSKQKCLNRKRGGINIDFFDYEKLKIIGLEAFNISAGRIYKISNSYIKLKIKPKAGFRAYKNIKARINKKDFKTEDLSKEELLFLSVYGRSRKGLRAYLKVGAYNKEIFEGLSAGVLRFLMA